ncbi:MAG: hypothetical protein K2Z81_25160, partial [Cyanobacteria bacterium]|nr:hypothetical protein [Cyanobacteriota bacterium]
SKLKSLHDLKIAGSYDLVNQDAARLRPLTKLERLELTGPHIDGGVGLYLAHLPSLRSVVLSNSRAQDIRYLSGLPQLSEVSLSLGRLTADSGAALASLKHLNILELSNIELEPLAFKNLSGTTLQVLKLAGEGLSEECLRSIETIQSLKTLDLMGCTGIRGSYLRGLDSLRSLENLLFDVSALNEESAKALSKVRSLRRLTIGSRQSDKVSINQPVCRSLLQCRSLRALNLGGSRIDSTLAETLSAMPKLQKIRLTNCQLDFGALSKIATSRTLRDLTIYVSTYNLEELPSLAGAKSLKSFYARGAEVNNSIYFRRLKQMRPDLILKDQTFVNQ